MRCFLLATSWRLWRPMSEDWWPGCSLPRSSRTVWRTLFHMLPVYHQWYRATVWFKLHVPWVIYECYKTMQLVAHKAHWMVGVTHKVVAHSHACSYRKPSVGIGRPISVIFGITDVRKKHPLSAINTHFWAKMDWPFINKWSHDCWRWVKVTSWNLKLDLKMTCNDWGCGQVRG